MTQTMTISVVGTGAIGGYYGAKLARAGHDVHFLLHSDYDHVRQHGLQVRSVNGDFALPCVNAYRSTAQMPPSDVVLVCLKSTNQHLLPALLPPLLRADTLVVLVQNGIGLEQDFARRFPGVAVAAGLAYICASKTEPGIVHHQNNGLLRIANHNCPDPGRIAALVEALRGAGVKSSEENLAEARWKKAVWNVPFNGMSVAYDADTAHLLSDPHTEGLIRVQMYEVVDAASALGVANIDRPFADRMLEGTRSMAAYSPSMRLDHIYHRPMELHYIYRTTLDAALTVAVPMPQTDRLYRRLLEMDV